MYNGIGLTTPRGTGTSGHVVRNKSALNPPRRVTKPQQTKDKKTHLDKGILEHEQRRQVEVRCLELQDSLEEQGDLDDEQIEKQVDELRQSLLLNIDHLLTATTATKSMKAFETYQRDQAKQQESQKWASALRIKDEYREGEAFDKDLRELRLEKRRLQREIEELESMVVVEYEDVRDGEDGEIQQLD